MDLLRDVRLAVRHLLKAPGYAGAAVLTLALAIGANSAIFSAVRTVLLDPLPIRQPGDLVICWETDEKRGGGVIELSYRNFQDWSTHSKSFVQSAVIGSSAWTSVLEGRGDAVRVSTTGVSWSLFEMFGVRPHLGRLFRPDDDAPNAPLVTILSHGAWVRRFGADPYVVGTTIRFNERPHTIIGVMPAGFDFPRGTEFWRPVVPIFAGASKDWATNTLVNVGVLFVIGRLHEGVTPAMAREELDRVASALATSTPPPGGTRAPRFGANVVVTPFLDYLLGPVRPALWALFAAVGVLLLIACANVSGLMLTRVSLRHREHAIRLALGASRLGLGRLWALETFVLAVTGGVLGLIASRWIAAAIVALAPDDVPRLTEVAIDGRVAVFTAVVVIATALLCGLGPMRHAGKSNLVESLNDAARGSSGGRTQRTRSALLVLQIGLAVVLLVAAGLVVRSFVTLRQLDLGFMPADVLTLQVAPRGTQPTKLWIDDLLGQIAKWPDVEAAGAVYLRPLALGPVGQGTWVVLEGQPDTQATYERNPGLNYQTATPGYFEAMRIPLKRGRLFTAQDAAGMPNVAIVSETTARRLWPGQDPIGKRMLLPTFIPRDKTHVWRTVVGVVSDVRYRGLDDVQLDIYDPALQAAIPAGDLVVRTTGDPVRLVGAIVAEARRRDPRVLVDGMTTMDAIVGRAVAPWRLSVWMFTVFAGLAFALATVGLFSVVSLDVVHRSREFAIRVALGAQRADIRRRVLVFATWRVLIGISLGLLIAIAGTQWMRSLLFGIDPLDGVTYALVIALVVVVVALAAWLPARRASVIDPLILLKRD
jgi:putative ABC transport system permease protein